MKILLDENIDIRFRHMFPEHEVYTVFYMKWQGITNGELLKLMIEHNLEVLLTRDQALYTEQSVAQIGRIAVILLKTRSGKLTMLQQKKDEISSLLMSIEPSRLYIIN